MGPSCLFLLNLLFLPVSAGFLLFFLLTPRRGLLKNLLSELPERCSAAAAACGTGAIWLHAASVGEAGSLSLLIKGLRAKYPDRPILISSTTAAGRKAALALKPDAAVLAPLDFYPFASSFVGKYRPCALIILERDLWPNMITAAHSSGIPVCIVNGRMSQRSAGRYALAAFFMRYIFGQISLVCAQTAQDAERYLRLGVAASKLAVTGNLKYDLLEQQPSKAGILREALDSLGWSGRKLLVMGSTHPSEEELLAGNFGELKSACPSLKVIVAPRHLERLRQIEDSLAASGLKTVRLSAAAEQQADSDCLLVDSMGLLTSCYYFASLCFIGGTIAPKGGHNMLEAAILGKPLLFGPHHFNTPEVARRLLESGAAFEVSVQNFLRTAVRILSDDGAAAAAGAKAAEAALSFIGATEKTLPVLSEAIK